MLKSIMPEKNFDVVIEFSREKQLQNHWFSDCTITVESHLKLCRLDVASPMFFVFADVTMDKNHGKTKWRKYL